MACCDNKESSLAILRERQRSTLMTVLLINVFMFVVVIIAALASQSSALLSDSLDNLGDALTYILSLYVISRNRHAKAKVALFKGLLIFLAAALVISQIIYRVANPAIPSYQKMGIFSVAALFGNAVCLYLLQRHRHEDINMSSVFECSRNDIAANLSVLLASFGVWLFDAMWPDIVIASLLAILLLSSSARVIYGSLLELRLPLEINKP